ncbi:DUF1257 domain-containing protein [bacterium]|nr:DUF1257 domain-containing protein [bacterium]
MSSFAIVSQPLKGVDFVFIDGAFLIGALAELGHMIKREMKEIQGARGCTESADIVASSKVNSDIDIGFRKRADGSYECIADWLELEKAGLDREEFIKKVAQKYSYLKTIDQAKKEGYQVVEEKSEVDGSIRVKLRQYK